MRVVVVMVERWNKLELTGLPGPSEGQKRPDTGYDDAYEDEDFLGIPAGIFFYIIHQVLFLQLLESA